MTHVVGDDEVVQPAVVAAYLAVEELGRLHAVLARGARQAGAGRPCSENRGNIVNQGQHRELGQHLFLFCRATTIITLIFLSLLGVCIAKEKGGKKEKKKRGGKATGVTTYWA